MEDHICGEIKPLIPDFHDGEIKDKELYIKISEHLKVCKDCRIELQELEELSKIVKKYFDVDEFEKDYKYHKDTEHLINRLDEVQYCNNVRDKISAYIDDELLEQDRLIVEKHLRKCIVCYKDYENLKLTSKIVQKYFKNLNFPESDVSDRVIERLDRHKSKKIAISLAVAAVLGIALFHFMFINAFKFENFDNKSLKNKNTEQSPEKKSKTEKFLPGLSF